MAGFFRIVELHADDLAGHGGAIRAMRAGAIEGLRVRGVYAAASCAALCARLEAGQHRLVRTDFPAVMRSFFLGINLNLADPALRAYFAAAPGFRAALAELFAGIGDLQARVSSVLAALDGGRRYIAAPGPAPGLEHMFTTLRAHLPGGFIPPHFDNEQAFRDSYRFVRAGIGADLYSFVLAFARPEAAGMLEVFDRLHDGKPWRMADQEFDAARIDLAGVESVRLELEPGELILFNSGRYLHRVVPVEGRRIRWTACSFMAESRAGDAVHCWG